jgi:hypothetical protein
MHTSVPENILLPLTGGSEQRKRYGKQVYKCFKQLKCINFTVCSFFQHKKHFLKKKDVDFEKKLKKICETKLIMDRRRVLLL